MASSSGAISKDTPTKEFKRLTLTPRAKSNNCGVCDKSLAEDSNKRRLFQPGFGPGTEKTEAALNLQYLLNEELNFEYTLNYICRSCNGKVATAVKSVKKIKEDYYKTKERIKNIYSKQPVVKRLARSTDEDVPKCRKHLFTPGNIETGDRGPPSSMSMPTINTKGTTCGSGNSVQV
ncbi:hypothetical protein SNE40_005928 [Patella caerulea]|uniref:Uncharacterized protein n=1 Tax=Patella caerulea TaxID=87958 RepID=A0AAN8K0G4_PATCE